MNKFFLLALAVVLSLSLTSGIAIAGDVWPPEPTLDTPYMTLQYSEAAKTSFAWTEQPFIFLWLPLVDSAQTLVIKNVWKYGGSEIATQEFSFPGVSSYKDWSGLSNWFDDYRKAGDWSVDTHWGYLGSKIQMCTTSWTTVTPEPIGAALFLLGGLAFSTRKFFQKNPK